MRNTFFYLTLLLASLTAPTLVTAGEGYYAGLLGGVNLLQKDHHHGHNIDYKTGYAVGGVVGYAFCDDIRVEAEVTYRRNNVKEVSFGDEHVKGGHRRSISAMANALYDVELGYPVTPYIGVGVGADWDRLATNATESHRNSRKVRFAAQAIAGVTYPVCDNVGISVDYRFHWAMHHRYNHTVVMGVQQSF